MDKSDGAIQDPYIAALRFNPQQLTRAREIQGLTKTALADRIYKTPSAITQFENGLARPDSKTIASIALALGMPIGFFARNPLATKIELDSCNFRSLRSVSQYLRRQAVQVAGLIHELMKVLENEGIELPKEQVSHLCKQVRSTEDVEQLAVDVRKAWGLGLGPIPKPIVLLESKGIRVLPLVDVCQDVDAFSLWHEGQPFIMLAMQKSASRSHFDAAHELGHLIMHEDVSQGDPGSESQAHHFA